MKKRLDILIQELYPEYSRNQIQSFIMQGKVLVDGQKETKSGTMINNDKQEVVLVVTEQKYVSRGGFKLEEALRVFGINPSGLICLDAGVSTGGFTDCLLQNNALRVYGIDVGYGQVHEKILTNDRFILCEKTNIRYLTNLPEKIDLITLDLSFISLLKVISAIKQLLKPVTGIIIALIKPQFEAEKKDIGKKGLVKGPYVYTYVLQTLKEGFEKEGLELLQVIESPILGATSGNKEFLGLIKQKDYNE